MNTLSILSEIAALAGYSIAGTTTQEVSNKARALRRLNVIKADIISRYGGKWDANYREGWLPLVAIETTGTATFTLGSRTVTGSGTAFTSAMKGYKIKGPDGAFYKIASYVSATSLILTQPFQGATAAGAPVFIWKDEYRLYPEVLTVGGFVDYELQGVMQETWPRNMKDSFSNPSYTAIPDVYTVVGRDPTSTSYSSGTVSVTANTNVWTGATTSWLSNVEPGMAFTVGAYTYHVKRVNSDTELETYQTAVVAVTGASYSIIGKNAMIVRFKLPTNQRIVNYWYWAKDYPVLNDSDEDWIMELYPEVILNGAVRKDYLDKNDVARASLSKAEYEDAIKNMKVAIDGAFTGPRTIGYFVPDAARE